MSETTFYLIGIAVLCALIFFSAAKTLGEFAFLLSLVLIGGGGDGRGASVCRDRRLAVGRGAHGQSRTARGK